MQSLYEALLFVLSRLERDNDPRVAQIARDHRKHIEELITASDA